MAEDGAADRFWKHVMRWYPAVRHRTAPWTPLRVPLAQARVALVTSCGVHLRTDAPFDLADRRGDPTFRAIPADATAAELTITHAHYDTRDARADLNVVLPLDRLRELVADGVVGAAASRHYGFMGSIPLPGRLIRRTAPAVAARLAADGVDVVLLTPC